MDDKFLYQLREQPDAEFANILHRKLTQLPVEAKRMNVYDLMKNRRLVQVAALFVIVVIAVMAISPARAVVSSLITDIAGQLFEVTDDYPGDNDSGDKEIIEPRIMSLGDALAAFPYNIQLPTNIPSEYTLNEDTVLVWVGDDAGISANTILFSWRSTTLEGFFLLNITDRDWTVAREIVAPNSVEEIFLDDTHTAVLIRGGWDADHKAWSNEYGQLRLRWQLGDLYYELIGTDQEQLIEIAISTLK